MLAEVRPNFGRIVSCCRAEPSRTFGRTSASTELRPISTDDTQLYVEMTDRGSLVLALHQLSPALGSAQSSATQWKQVRRHHHWGQLNVALGRRGRHICVSLRVVLQSVTVWSFLARRYDHTMSFNKHFSTVVRACNFHLSALRHIRSLVSDTVAQQIACSIVGSRLDYCNSLLVNCSNRNLDKLQRVQDNLARVVCNSNRSTSAGPLIRSLHWLPVRQRINFKLAKLCYLVTSFQQPVYLADLISPYSQSRLLRSSTQKLLSFPPHNLDTRRFFFAAPRLWNSLPLNCRTAPSVNTFKIRHFSLIRHNRTVARASVLWHIELNMTMARYKFIDWLIDNRKSLTVFRFLPRWS